MAVGMGSSDRHQKRRQTSSHTCSEWLPSTRTFSSLRTSGSGNCLPTVLGTTACEKSALTCRLYFCIALVDSLECYMDDLVDCFEDFVKKSLILISVGVATVVAMFVYMLKVLKDRPETPSTAGTNDQNLRRCNSNTSIPSTASKSSSKRNRSDYVIAYDPNTIGSSAKHYMQPTPSSDERLLREFGYMNCNRSCELKPRALPSIPPHSRISIPSLPSCYTKQHLPSPRNCVKVLRRTSCCSMCCDDK